MRGTSVVFKFHIDKNLLKRYMTKVMKPYQYRHLLRRMRFNDSQYIHFGSEHYLVVRNNHDNDL